MQRWLNIIIGVLAVVLIIIATMVVLYLQRGTGPSEERIMQVLEGGWRSMGRSVENLVINGSEDCPLISGDQARGVQQRKLLSLSYVIVSEFGGRDPINELPIFNLIGGEWVKDRTFAGRCPR